MENNNHNDFDLDSDIDYFVVLEHESIGHIVWQLSESIKKVMRKTAEDMLELGYSKKQIDNAMAYIRDTAKSFLVELMPFAAMGPFYLLCDQDGSFVKKVLECHLAHLKVLTYDIREYIEKAVPKEGEDE